MRRPPDGRASRPAAATRALPVLIALVLLAGCGPSYTTSSPARARLAVPHTRVVTEVAQLIRLYRRYDVPKYRPGPLWAYSMHLKREPVRDARMSEHAARW